jgi:hypothetical protein
MMASKHGGKNDARGIERISLVLLALFYGIPYPLLMILEKMNYPGSFIKFGKSRPLGPG